MEKFILEVKKYFKKLKGLWVISLGVLFMGPVLINELYKVNKGYITLWDAKDVLAYYGAALGAVCTVIALIMTILYTEFQRKESRKNEIKPLLDCDSEMLGANSSIDKESECILLKFERLSSSSTIGTEQYNDIKSGKCICIKYLIENLGSGNAIMVNFAINGHTVLRPFHIKINTKKTVYILMYQNYLDDLFTTLNINLYYRDTDELAYYCQKEVLSYSDNVKALISITDKLDGQKEIEKETYVKSKHMV